MTAYDGGAHARCAKLEREVEDLKARLARLERWHDVTPDVLARAGAPLPSVEYVLVWCPDHGHSCQDDCGPGCAKAQELRR